MKLSETTSKHSFILGRPGDSVVSFHFKPSDSPARDGHTIISIPKGSTWSPGPHWHERYVEYVQVRQGSVCLLVNGKKSVITAEDGVQTIPKFAIHNWMRADSKSPADNKDDEEVIVEEWTDPSKYRTS